MRTKSVTTADLINLPMWELLMNAYPGKVRFKLPLNLMVAGRLYQDRKRKGL